MYLYPQIMGQPMHPQHTGIVVISGLNTHTFKFINFHKNILIVRYVNSKDIHSKDRNTKFSPQCENDPNTTEAYLGHRKKK